MHARAHQHVRAEEEAVARDPYPEQALVEMQQRGRARHDAIECQDGPAGHHHQVGPLPVDGEDEADPPRQVVGPDEPAGHEHRPDAGACGFSLCVRVFGLV